MSLAVVVVDMFNPYDHEDADALVEHVEPIVEPVAQLIATARERETELVYVNDNYGDFTATRHDIVRNAREGRRPDLIDPLVPPDAVDFLSKARHSAFYSTALDHLLRERGVDTIVLAGQVTEQCILYSALDAYVRGFDIRVPPDAVAAIDDELGAAALKMMEGNMRVDLLDVDACVG